MHIAQTLLYTIGLHISLDICLQIVLLPPSRSISHLWLCTVTKEGRLIHLDGGVLLLLMYMQMHVLTLQCGFCKSRKTTLVKLVKWFNAKQMQKCLFDCLLLASFSVVISLSYFVWSISLVRKACKFPNRFLHPVSNFLPNKLYRAIGIPTWVLVLLVGVPGASLFRLLD